MAIAPTTTDATLVRRLQERDAAAWEDLFAEYQPRLRAFGYRLTGNVHDAEDLVQETFVRALPALDRLDPDRVDLTAYLFATTKNLFLKQVERGKRAEPTAEVPEPDLPTAIEDDPERSALLRRQQEEVRVANARLDPRQRLVLALCELEDRSHAEIGELVGLNENAVAQLVFRARERLRTELRLVQVDPERLPEECRAFLPLLAQHLDGKLRGPRLESMLAHLEGCERCQAALADMREAKRRYRALLLPPLGVSTEEARAAVEHDLEQAGYWRGTGARRVLFRRPRGAAAVAGAIAAGVLLTLAGGGAAVLLTGTDAPRELRAAGPETQPSTRAPAASTTTPPTGRAVAPAPPKAKAPVMPTTAPTQAATTAPTPTVAPPKATKQKPTPRAVPPPTATGDRPLRGQSPKGQSPQGQAPDRTAPTITITGAPGPSSAATTATFTFTADEAPVTFQCRLDGGAWQACSSPRNLDGLTPGEHLFSVRATDAAGNVGAPATRRWTVTPPPDTTAPSVAFSSTPPAATTSRSASFTFSASEPGVSFACSYDGGPFQACQSPHTVTDAGVDDHTLAVRATDAAGNTGAPAIASWTVLPQLPDLVVVLADAAVTVRNAGAGAAGASLVTVTGIGTFPIPALVPGQAVTRSFRCVRGTHTATADYAQSVAEGNEQNNAATHTASCLGLTS